ncbi:MAG TPA: carbon storage regulator [Pirellulales bacterium]|nr:carbon storage regulator [Pirellulales bacterium]
MLVLTRKTQQQIQFGDDIVVTILQVKGHSVRVGIEAPRGVRVVRGEIASKPPREAMSVAQHDAAAENSQDVAEPARIGRTAKNNEVAHAGKPSASNFSSLASPLPHPAGESSGLFPRLRRRASSSPTTENTLPRTQRCSSLVLCSLAGSRF